MKVSEILEENLHWVCLLMLQVFLFIMWIAGQVSVELMVAPFLYGIYTMVIVWIWRMVSTAYKNHQAVNHSKKVGKMVRRDYDY